MVDHDQTLLFGIWSRSKFEICFILFPSGCHVIIRIFRENFSNFEAKKLFVSWSFEGWQILVSFVINIDGFVAPNTKNTKNLREFLWSCLLNILQINAILLECLNSRSITSSRRGMWVSFLTIFEEHTREVTAMYQEVPRAVRRVVSGFLWRFWSGKTMAW